MYQLLLYQQKTMQNYENYYATDLKDLFIGTNISKLTIKQQKLLLIMRKNTQENSLIQVIKESKDYLFLVMIIQQVMIEFLLILSKNIFFQELKQKITTSKLMEEIYMISQLMTQLSKTRKSENYQQDKVMIIQLLVYQILLILKKIAN